MSKPAAVSKPLVYLPYSEAVERLHPNEEQLSRLIVESMARVNRKLSDRHRHGLRDAHAKSHGVVKGELRVHADLPPHLRQGLFAKPKSYPIVVRFSTAPGDLASDAVPTHRGMAIKVVGVEGPRAVDDGAVTQDFLLVNSPTIPFGDVQAYFELQQKLEKNTIESETLAKLVAGGARLAASVLKATHQDIPLAVELLAAENNHILGETFHSMAALRYGDYLGKFSAAPAIDSLRELSGRALPHDAEPSALRDLVGAYFRQHSATYDLRVQLCTDLEGMPVENAAVLWSEDVSPQQVIASIVIPAQESYSDKRRIYVDDVMSFSPWHALAAHRPLGSIMRIRKLAYEASSARRHAMNLAPTIEPRDLNELPD